MAAPTDITESSSHRAILSARLAALGLLLNEPEPAILCIRCGFALKPSGGSVSKHLGGHDVSAQARKGLKQLINSLQLDDPNQLSLREDYCEPHPHLMIKSGVACKYCNFRSTSHDLAERHISKVHGRASGDKPGYRNAIRDGVSLQSWSQNGPRSYWIVKAVIASNSSLVIDPIECSPRRRERITMLHDIERRRLKRPEEDGMTIEDEVDDPALVSNWMRRTGWLKTFAGADRRLLSLLDQMPAVNGRDLDLGCYGKSMQYSSAGNERQLAMIGQAVDRFFDRCEDTVLHTEHSIRCWLRSPIAMRPNKAPFELPMRESTKVKYRRLTKKMLFVLVRLYHLDSALREQFLRVQLSEKQCKAVQLLLAAVEKHKRGNPIEQNRNRHRYIEGSQNPTSLDAYIGFEESEEDDSDSDFSEDSADLDHFVTGEQDNKEKKEGLICDNMYAERIITSQRDLTGASILSDELADSVGKLLLFLCTEQFVDNRSSSTFMVYFSGLMSFPSPGTTFDRPGNYTPKLSALIYCSRLCLLEATLPRSGHPSIGWKARPPVGGLKRLNKSRERFMSQGCQAPMGELLSLRSYGRAISRSDGPNFRVSWSDDGNAVTWDAGKQVGELTMDQLRALGRTALNSATNALKRLMYGMTPKIQLASIRDRLSNQTRGYSFVQDPLNQLQAAYLELSSHVCLHQTDGLMASDQWNMANVNRYLAEEVDFLTSFELVMYLRGGQAVRASELFSIMHKNSSSSSRGIYVHEGRIVYVTRHSKARQATNHEFHVARYLPLEDSELLATYLAYVRPFTDMVCRLCLQQKEERQLFFSSFENPATPWTVDMLTKAMRQLTKDVCGIGFGVQIYRQLSIAVTEKHVKQISKPFNRYDDKGPNADIAVAFSWQSGHRPLQRGTAYGIDAAFPDSLQPELLRVYQWASREWHTFLGADNPTLSTTASHISNQENKRRRPSTSLTRSPKRSKTTPDQLYPDEELPAVSIIPAIDIPVVVHGNSSNQTFQRGQYTSTGCFDTNKARSDYEASLQSTVTVDQQPRYDTTSLNTGTFSFQSVEIGGNQDTHHFVTLGPSDFVPTEEKARRAVQAEGRYLH